jgi:uncharacterized protein (TIGR00725 family)
MGAAGGTLVNKSNQEKAFRIGEEIARNDCIIINGATTGLPYSASEGAKSKGGIVIGISPAESKKDHVQNYKKPTENFDAIIYTGYGFTARNVLNIRSSQAVIILPGGKGTLTEFSVAYEEGKILGVLTECGGIAEVIPKIIESLYSKSGSIIIYEQNPVLLVQKIVKELEKNELS